MTRRWLLGFATFLAACTPSSKPLPDVLPRQLGAFRLGETRKLESTEAPELVRSLGVKNGIEAVYEEKGKITVHLFEMNVATSAFELIQKWPQSEGLAVYGGPYFVIFRPQNADSTVVGDFIRQFRNILT